MTLDSDEHEIRVVHEGRILTVLQVAELVQLSAKTVMRAIHAGDLEASQLTAGRGGWRVRDEAIARWLDVRQHRPQSTPVRPVEPRRQVNRRASAQNGRRLVA